MDQQTKIGFNAVDNGVSSFMKKIQTESKAMFADYMKEAQKQTNNSKEQLKIIEQQIKALERKTKLERDVSIIQQQRIKENATLYSMDYWKADARLDDLRRSKSETSVVLGSLKDMLSDLKGKEDKPSAVNAKQIFAAILSAGIVKDLFSTIRQMPGARSEFDLIPAAGSLTGAGLGAALGLFMSPGTTQVGKEIGGFVGSAYTRHLLESEKYLGAALKVKGLTGQASQAGDLSTLGLDRVAGAQLEESIVNAIAKGTSAQQIKNIAALSKSIDIGTITSFLATGRMGVNANEMFLNRLGDYGISRPQRGVAAQNITQLLQLMGQTTLTPNISDAASMVIQGNQIGGPFSAQDPRSIGFLSQIQSNLVNPKGAFAQAMSFKALRALNPNASIVQLLKMRQQGGPEYERAILNDIASMTGSSDFATLLYSGNFGTGNIAADELRLRNRDKINRQARYFGPGGEEELYNEGAGLTSNIAQSQAAVTNAFITSFTSGINELAVRFTDRMSQAVDQFVETKLKKVFTGVDANINNSPYHKPQSRGASGSY